MKPPSHAAEPVRIVVIGSIMVDRVAAVPEIVRAGATLTARGLAIHPGGKGANQAAAAARAGATVRFAGRTGRDGAFVLEALRACGVDTAPSRIDEGASGTAFVQVSGSGENAIVIVPEANARFDRDDLARAIDGVRPGDLVLLQNETALLGEAIAAAAERGARVWLNAAPAEPGLLDLPLERLDALLVNETEAAILAGNAATPAEALERLCTRLETALVVVTLGAAGTIAGRGDARSSHPAFPVRAIDTVGCGDAFVGALAAAIADRRPLDRALREACAAGSLAATKPGAIPSLPSRAEIAALAATAR